MTERGEGRTLIGDAERERVVAMLREHYAAGRLSLDELTRRTELALGAVYTDEAAAALAELPGAAFLPGGAPASGTADPSRAGWLRRRGHAQSSEPNAGWVPTAERFRDPSSGAIMRVWVDPADGSRHYVPDGLLTVCVRPCRRVSAMVSASALSRGRWPMSMRYQ
ncbi:MAG TPA: DUF1707 domain-containing protein [Streptosporangiaceae bacterium]|nr:DUF1707 domain-containing protein [Streptosporangiaceae bacterium]